MSPSLSQGTLCPRAWQPASRTLRSSTQLLSRTAARAVSALSPCRTFPGTLCPRASQLGSRALTRSADVKILRRRPRLTHLRLLSNIGIACWHSQAQMAALSQLLLLAACSALPSPSVQTAPPVLYRCRISYAHDVRLCTSSLAIDLSSKVRTSI